MSSPIHIDTQAEYRKQSFFSDTTVSRIGSELYIDTTLEDRLEIVVGHLRSQMDITMERLEACTGKDKIEQELMQFMKMINAVDLVRMHLELILAIIRSKSEAEVKASKEKYNLIKDRYERVKSSEDLTIVPIQSVALFMQEKIFRELEKNLNACFRKHSDGIVELINTEDNRGRIQIMAFEFEVCAFYFPQIATFSKTDIFSYDKSSQLWQDLYKCATFKKIGTKEDVQKDFKQLYQYINISYYVIKKYIEEKTPGLQSKIFLLRDIIYYAAQATKAETQALLYLLNPSIDHAFKAWNMTEHTFLAGIRSLGHPSIGHDEYIFIPRLFPMITKDIILKEYKDLTLNKLQKMDEKELIIIDEKTIANMHDEIVEDLFVESLDKVPIRIIAHKRLFLKSTKKAHNKQDNPDIEDSQGIVIHIHGGGFVAQTSKSHKVYLTRWVKKLRMVHFCIDYRLAPENKYPAALDDVWQAYLWIVNYSRSVLGIKTPKVIVSGDSAGGNLALGLSLRLVRAGIKPPDGLFLAYPALLMDILNCSPSYYRALDDPLLHFNLLKLCLKAYLSEEFDPLKDPFISPLVASDELLEKLPPIRIVVGSDDPFHDDSWRLVAKLRKLEKDVKIIVHDSLVHGFLSFQEIRNFDLIMEEGCQIIRELVSL